VQPTARCTTKRTSARKVTSRRRHLCYRRRLDCRNMGVLDETRRYRNEPVQGCSWRCGRAGFRSRTPVAQTCAALHWRREMLGASRSPVGYGLAQPKGLAERKAVDTVERYVRLRLSGAHWVAFAPLIGWEDEPGDCRGRNTALSDRTGPECTGAVTFPNPTGCGVVGLWSSRRRNVYIFGHTGRPRYRFTVFRQSSKMALNGFPNVALSLLQRRPRRDASRHVGYVRCPIVFCLFEHYCKLNAHGLFSNPAGFSTDFTARRPPASGLSSSFRSASIASLIIQNQLTVKNFRCRSPHTSRLSTIRLSPSSRLAK